MLAGPTDHCRSCGYCLTGLAAGMCPECGVGFDPGDSRTLRALRTRGAVLMRFAAVASLAASVWLAGVMMWESSKLLGIDLFEVIRLLWALVLTATLWAIGVTTWLFRSAEGRGRFRREGALFSVTAVMWFVAIALMCAGVPGMIRWRIEEPDLARFSQTALSDPFKPGLVIPKTLFGRERLDISVEPYGVQYRIAGGFMQETFLVYAPAGPPVMPSQCTVDHQRGCWYVVWCAD